MPVSGPLQQPGEDDRTDPPGEDPLDSPFVRGLATEEPVGPELALEAQPEASPDTTVARPIREEKPRGVVAFLTELPVLLLIAFLLALLIKTFLVQAFFKIGRAHV